MILQSLLFTLFLAFLGAHIDAFSAGRASFVGTSLNRQQSRPSTCLFADEAEESTTAQEDDGEKMQLPDESHSDILNSPAFLKRKIDVLKSDIAKAEEELEAAKARAEAGKSEWGPQLDALEKEYENISNRMKERSKAGDTEATILVARKFLELLDNYDRAFGAVTAESEEEKEIEAAYKNTYKMILDTFSSLGIQEVETVGKEFDYEIHQAVLQRESEYDEGIVCEEMAKGYILGDKLIRAAMVCVSY